MTGSCAARRGSAALSRSSLVALVLGLVLSLAGLSSAQRLCNGFADLCARSYSEVAFAVTHNAYAVGTSIASNQNMPITRQLEDGIRAFKLTVMRNPNGADPNQIRLCHGQCGDNTIFADGGALVDTLATFQKFLAGNPNDVITIFVENQKSILATDIMKDFELAELAGYCYEHPTNEDAWPTLQTMISTNKRAVVFVDRVVRPGDTDVAQSVGWFMAELGYVASNYWLNTVQGQWTCKQHQPYDANTGDILPRNLWLLNHLMYNNVSATVQIPARNKANVTNQIVSLQDHANQCLTTYARPQVNFISVDFYEVVDYAVLRIVDALNRVQRSSYGTGPVTTMTHSRTTKTSLATTTTVEATQTAQGSGMTRNPPSGAGKIAANIGVTLIGGFVVALL